VFLGAPYVERLIGNPALRGALAAVTAAVVGVIANLALWFALHVLFRRTVPLHGFGLHLDVPSPGSLDLAALGLAALSGLLLLRLGAGVVPTLAASTAAGVLLHLIGWA